MKQPLYFNWMVIGSLVEYNWYCIKFHSKRYAAELQFAENTIDRLIKSGIADSINVLENHQFEVASVCQIILQRKYSK